MSGHYKPYKHKRVNGVLVDVHVLVWMDFHNCKVPKGHCIHHKDGDRWNNDPKNLECLTIGRHHSIHAKAQKRLKNGRFK